MHSRDESKVDENEQVEKEKSAFRNYDNQPRIETTYRRMYQYQNLFFGRVMRQHFANGSGVEMSFEEAFDLLEDVMDASDPDVKHAKNTQIYHAFQTGEALKDKLSADDKSKLKPDIKIRDLFTDVEWDRLSSARRDAYPTYLHELYPEITDWAWLPLIGFLHDVGKVLATKKLGEVPQWAVVGDTVPVGAPFSASNVYSEKGYHLENPDLAMKTEDGDKFGIYQKYCGLNKVKMTFGHDEYLYSVLSNTKHHLPDAALYLVRFHSFYAWHSPRNEIRGYEELADDLDWKMLPLLKMFHEGDLYSKRPDLPDIKQLRDYYFGMLKKYVPGRERTYDNQSPEQEFDNGSPTRYRW